MPFYRLLAGRHVGPAIKDCDCERCEIDHERIKTKDLRKGLKGHLYNRGDIVESDLDLIGRFPEKFELVDRGGHRVEQPLAAMPQSRVGPSQSDFLNTMTKQELTDYAAAEEIDVSGCSTKSELIQAIRTAVVA